MRSGTRAKDTGLTPIHRSPTAVTRKRPRALRRARRYHARVAARPGPTTSSTGSAVDSCHVQAIQRWFDRRGLTLLLRDTGVGAGTSVRSVRALLVLLLLMSLVVVPLSTDATLPVALLVNALALLLTWVGGNLARHRPSFAPVRSIGWVEAVAFVVAPTIALVVAPYSDVVVEDITVSAVELRLVAVLVIVSVQLLLLALVLVVVMLGLVSLSALLARQLLGSLSSSGTALAALLLGVVFFFFLNPDVWVTIGRLPPTPYTTVIALLLLLAGAFLGSRAQLDIDALSRFESTDDWAQALVDTPLDGAVARHGLVLEEPTTCPLGRRQEMAVRLVAVISRLVLAAVIASAVFAFFVVLGYLAVDAETVKGWTRVDPTAVLQVTTSVRAYVLSQEHLRVAGFLATFAAFNYSLASATDDRLRHDAAGAATEMVRQACAARMVLLWRRPAHHGREADIGPGVRPDVPTDPEPAVHTPPSGETGEGAPSRVVGPAAAPD